MPSAARPARLPSRRRQDPGTLNGSATIPSWASRAWTSRVLGLTRKTTGGVSSSAAARARAVSAPSRATQRAIDGSRDRLIEPGAVTEGSQHELMKERAIPRRQGLDVGASQPLGQARAATFGIGQDLEGETAGGGGHAGLTRGARRTRGAP